MNPFDVITDITLKKQGLITSDNEKEYNPYLTNRGLSYFPDTLHHAQEMNQLHHLDKKMQYDFFINSINPRKRFSPWAKKSQVEYLDAIKEYYGYNDDKALQALRILSKTQL